MGGTRCMSFRSKRYQRGAGECELETLDANGTTHVTSAPSTRKSERIIGETRRRILAANGRRSSRARAPLRTCAAVGDPRTDETSRAWVLGGVVAGGCAQNTASGASPPLPSMPPRSTARAPLRADGLRESTASLRPGGLRRRLLRGLLLGATDAHIARGCNTGG